MNRFTVLYRSSPRGMRKESELKDVTIETPSAYGAALQARSHRDDIDYIVAVKAA